MLAVGEHLWGQVPDQALKMTTAFSGGVGRTHRDLCGALSAGIMIIGAQHGRTRPDVDDARCQELATRYRDRFAQELGSVYCYQLRGEAPLRGETSPPGPHQTPASEHPHAVRYGSQGDEPCSVLVGRATRILLEVLEDAGSGSRTA